MLVDSGLVRHDMFPKGNCAASSASSVPSVADTMPALVLLGHGSASIVKQQVSHSDSHFSLKQNRLTTQHFDISVGDADEVEEEFFPGDRPLIDCS